MEVKDVNQMSSFLLASKSVLDRLTRSRLKRARVGRQTIICATDTTLVGHWIMNY